MNNDSASFVLARDVVALLGSQSALADLCGVRQQSVSEWCIKGKPIPPLHVLKVEAATGVSKHDLRPDLYPRDAGSLPSGILGDGAGGSSSTAPGAEPSNQLTGFAA